MKNYPWETKMRLKIPKGAIVIRKSKIERPHNGHKKKNIDTNNDLQNTTYKTKD